MINKLTIAHCVIDISAKIGPILTKIRTISPCFAPETCSRHIYFFMDLPFNKKQKLQQLCEELNKQSQHMEILDSYDAYEFLLQWSAGLLSKKYRHNDHFVLGRFRLFWTNYIYEAKGSAFLGQLLTVIPKLLENSSLVRRYIQTELEKLDTGARIEKTKHYCHRIRQSMEHPDMLSEQSTPITAEARLAKLQEQHAKLHQTIRALQKETPNQTIKLHPEANDEISILQLRKFSIVMQKIQEKRVLASKILSLGK